MTTTRSAAVFILTHGRPDNIKTLDMLQRSGYTGKIHIVIDNEDARADEYFERYGDMVLQFDKKAVADRIDDADTSGDRRAIIYARHAAQDMAKELGYDYMLQLDDDYADLRYRFIKNGVLTSYRVKNLDALFEATYKFLDDTDSLTVAFGQGGDMIGGINSPNYKRGLQRKAMNSFFIRTSKYVNFIGKINDDVNMYVVYGSRGEKVFTAFHVNVLQMATQANQGGMTELYLEEGTYAKSFYSVMMAPSCVKIYPMGTANRRLHHKVDWRYAVPCIINEKHKKVGGLK
jgi:hypothetical protein